MHQRWWVLLPAFALIILWYIMAPRFWRWLEGRLRK
jgi:hypothetical protein